MYIPSVRNKIERSPYGRERANAYYEGYLDNGGLDVLMGFDACFEAAMNAVAEIAEEVDEDALGVIETYMEASRNDLVVSLIESMPDDAWRRNVSRVSPELYAELCGEAL